jgi:protein TonB
MNISRQALLISLVLHGAVIFLIYAMSSTLASPYRTIVIDFTSMERTASSNPAAPTPGLQKGSGGGGGGGGPNIGHKPSRGAIAKPSARNTKKSPASTTTAHEPHGTVPLLAKPSEHTAPPPDNILLSAEEGVIDGIGTGVGSGSGSGSGSGRGSGSGSGDGTGNSVEQQRKRYLAEHFAYIRDIIEKNLTYPPLAERNGWTGTVIVFFNVQKDGRVKDIRIIKSSGYTILDENVIETIRKVQPFPKPPTSIDVKIPLSFGLE